MDAEEKTLLVSRNTAEIITLEELRRLFEVEEHPKGYLGFEPSGLFHLGWIIWARKVQDLIDAGVDFTLLEATWHAWINDKLGGNMELIKDAARYVSIVLESLGIDISRIRRMDAEELVSDKDYWAMLLKVAKSTSLARVKRALTIMGRRADEAEMDFSKLIYPCMQVTDIYRLDVDIALGGTDQRKAHILARELASKLKRKKIVAVHTPLLTGLQGAGRMDASSISRETHAVEYKMSKSKPETALFVHDSPEDIARKIMKAYCPPRTVEYNPILEINRYVLFPEPGFTLYVDRPAKYGGPLEIRSYGELEKLYVEGKLHPLDLKKATAQALIKMLEPVRRRFEEDREAKALLERIKSVKALR